MLGNVSSCLELVGAVWSSLEMFGDVWSCLELSGDVCRFSTHILGEIGKN